MGTYRTVIHEMSEALLGGKLVSQVPQNRVTTRVVFGGGVRFWGNEPRPLLLREEQPPTSRPSIPKSPKSPTTQPVSPEQREGTRGRPPNYHAKTRSQVRRGHDIAFGSRTPRSRLQSNCFHTHGFSWGDVSSAAQKEEG